MEELTENQAKLLAAVQRRIDHGEPTPSYRELCKEFGWKSTGTVRDHLKALAHKGYVDLSGRAHRRLRPRGDRPAVSSVQVIGRVVAGRPILAEENIEGSLPIPATWAPSGVHFALRVHGDSMIDVGIREGDHVVVRQQPVAEHGDIVVATLDGETTLKRFERSGKRVLLRAENARYEPVEVKTESFTIHGVVVGLLRAYRERRSSREPRRTMGRGA